MGLCRVNLGLPHVRGDAAEPVLGLGAERAEVRGSPGAGPQYPPLLGTLTRLQGLLGL